ncbi:hypothetical protein [Pseudonocardia sp.]|uniref:hypothetical protein n=1 Tax=Pseudonocardia sp. TaxID=60912 RepID=UPI003D0F7628
MLGSTWGRRCWWLGGTAAAGHGPGRQAHLLVGALAHSGRRRGVLAEAEDFPHLVEAIAGVVDRLDGVTRRWRFDRMATVCFPASGRVTPAFAAVAKHYGSGSTSARLGAATARAWSRRPTTLLRSAGGAPSTTSPWRPRRTGWTSSARGSIGTGSSP